VHTMNGAGMPIFHIGQSIVHTRDHDLVLKNMLHVPNAFKNLVSVHKFTHDNNAFFEFHMWYFFLKDWAMRKLLLQGRCMNGLYPLPTAAWGYNSQSSKNVLTATKPTITRWHHRLGHASPFIIQHIVNQNNLPHSEESLGHSVCDACQRAKSHQLPFPRPTSVSTAPLELVFSDVWGLALVSVGKFKYYVSFIDDYSKFSWLYLLKSKSDVFHKFHEFQ
jgi:hypothetical protein